MYANKDSKKIDPPFYELSSRRKSSAEIIREAKAEITMMSLKGSSSPYVKCSSANENNVNSGKDSRPASSLSCMTFMSDSCSSRPLSSVRLKPLRAKSAGHHETISKLQLEPTVIKSSLIDRKKEQKRIATNFDMPDCPSPLSSYGSEMSVRSTIEGRFETVSTHSHENFPPIQGTLQEEKCLKTQSIHVDNLVIGLLCESENTVDGKMTEVERFEVQINKLIPPLQKLVNNGNKKSESSGLQLISRLHHLMDDFNMLDNTFKHRSQLLIILFRLLNSHFPTLSLHVSKLVLEMRISEKNLANVCRLLYKVCHEEKNIVEFLACGVLAPFVERVKTIKAAENPLALRYSMSLICLLSAKDLLLDVMSVFNCHDILTEHLIQLNNLENCSSNEENCYIVVKIVTAVRYLSGNEAVLNALRNNTTCNELIKTLTLYQSNIEIIITTIRLLSKVSDSSEGCDAILSISDACEILGQLLENQKHQFFIILQVTSIIGNLLIHDHDASSQLFRLPNFIALLHSLLDNFVKNEVEALEKKESFCQNLMYSAGDSAGNKNETALTMKVIRILANMCLCPEIGFALAEDGTSAVHLLKILILTKSEGLNQRNEVLLCVLLALNNLTYFVNSDAENLSLYLGIFEGILPILDEKFPLDVRLEGCNIVQNLTRLPEVQTFVVKNRLVPAFVSLFEKFEHEIAVSGYYIMMNLLLDKAVRGPFYKEQGVTKLMHKLHLSIGRDWTTAALLCQILWNFCSLEKDEDKKPLSHMEVQHLVKVLHFANGPNCLLKTDSESVREAWSVHFCPVAEKLLKLLKTFT